jgi:hypothetical protein
MPVAARLLFRLQARRRRGRRTFENSAKVSRFAKPRSDEGCYPLEIIFESLFVRRSRDRLDCDQGLHHRLVLLWDANTPRTPEFMTA